MNVERIREELEKEKEENDKITDMIDLIYLILGRNNE